MKKALKGAKARSGKNKEPELVIVTGMSGAGRTEALHTFEDLGYYCIDNLPASLIDSLLALEALPGQLEPRKKIAVVCDARTLDFFNGFQSELESLERQHIGYRLLFLDADDAKLVARYKSSRRRHPLCDEGMTIGQGIQKERSLLFGVRESAHDVIDTTNMLPAQLRESIRSLFSMESDFDAMTVTVYSFGFKHGAADDADIVMDVRFLPNPYYDVELRPMTGLDKKVHDFVMYRTETEEFMKSWRMLLECVMPGYLKEGKQHLAIAIGCTGGQHRSVAIAEVTGDFLKAKGYRVSIAHRDLHLAEGGQPQSGGEGSTGRQADGAPAESIGG
ncbi:MAG: RNase adapter RapZ [Eggerthellaceae bacterium]|nr:RNase adapter RapZ [Eggerthellaceae bacterium]